MCERCCWRRSRLLGRRRPDQRAARGAAQHAIPGGPTLRSPPACIVVRSCACTTGQRAPRGHPEFQPRTSLRQARAGAFSTQSTHATTLLRHRSPAQLQHAVRITLQGRSASHWQLSQREQATAAQQAPVALLRGSGCGSGGAGGPQQLAAHRHQVCAHQAPAAQAARRRPPIQAPRPAWCTQPGADHPAALSLVQEARAVGRAAHRQDPSGQLHGRDQELGGPHPGVWWVDGVSAATPCKPHTPH
jgi:hypothetical protein